jgi:hypothetical protein
VALGLLRTLLGVRIDDGPHDPPDRVQLAVRAALAALFRAGNERNVFGRLVEWLAENEIGVERLLNVFLPLLQHPAWFLWQLEERTVEGQLVTDLIRQALNNDSSFEEACATLLQWSKSASQWDDTSRAAVEHLISSLACSLQHGVFRLFVELDRNGSEDWVGLGIAREALSGWRAGRHGEAS